MGNPRRPPPRLQTTTLWYYPSQQYGEVPMGNPAYEGRTPSYVIWNVLERYTRPGDLVVDPFCGGATTLDVATSLGRRSVGLDIEPGRGDVLRADARRWPLRAAVADLVFMDPPYSTHVRYSAREGCIGELDAFQPAYFEALEETFAEAERVLRDRRYLALFVSDTFKKKRGFVPIGTLLSGQLARRFRPVDHIAVVRGSRKLESPRFHSVAAEQNFFLRGFTHLLLFKKERGAHRR